MKVTNGKENWKNKKIPNPNKSKKFRQISLNLIALERETVQQIKQISFFKIQQFKS